MKEEAKKLLFSEESSENIIRNIDKIEDADILYYFIWHYNWDNGLEIPQSVLNNKYCDLSIALLTFFRADGLSLLLNEDIELTHWNTFIRNLFERLNTGYYKKALYEFSPELTKVQIFKIKKLHPDLPPFYYKGTQGKQLDLNI